MPELPEVETIKRYIASKLTGSKIIGIEVLLSRVIKWPDEAAAFQSRLFGKTIQSITRKGKYLLFSLEDEGILVIHLRMTGRLICSKDDQPDRFTRVVFLLNNGYKLYYSDIRTLGTLYAVKPSEIERIHGLVTIGPEPLSAEFTLEYLTKMIVKRKGKIKSLLLKQELIGGLGNIYADESLSLAKIHPERIGASLTANEIEKLFYSINQVIEDAITDGGTTFRDYLNGEGEKGSHQDRLLVYGRKGETCKSCGTDIQKIIVGGRGSYFCPKCQH